MEGLVRFHCPETRMPVPFEPDQYTTVPTRSAELLQLSWVDAGRPVETGDLRKLDTVLDRRWSAMPAATAHHPAHILVRPRARHAPAYS